MDRRGRDGAADFKDGENTGQHCEKEWPECAGALHLKMCLGIKYLIERTCFSDCSTGMGGSAILRMLLFYGRLKKSQILHMRMYERILIK